MAEKTTVPLSPPLIITAGQDKEALAIAMVIGSDRQWYTVLKQNGTSGEVEMRRVTKVRPLSVEGWTREKDGLDVQRAAQS